MDEIPANQPSLMPISLSFFRYFLAWTLPISWLYTGNSSGFSLIKLLDLMLVKVSALLGSQESPKPLCIAGCHILCRERQ